MWLEWAQRTEQNTIPIEKSTKRREWRDNVLIEIAKLTWGDDTTGNCHYYFLAKCEIEMEIGLEKSQTLNNELTTSIVRHNKWFCHHKHSFHSFFSICFVVELGFCSCLFIWFHIWGEKFVVFHSIYNDEHVCVCVWRLMIFIISA